MINDIRVVMQNWCQFQICLWLENKNNIYKDKLK